MCVTILLQVDCYFIIFQTQFSNFNYSPSLLNVLKNQLIRTLISYFSTSLFCKNSRAVFLDKYVFTVPLISSHLKKSRSNNQINFVSSCFFWFQNFEFILHHNYHRRN